jgi:hypothetical protein
MNKELSKEYMLIFRGSDWHKGLSPEEMQQIAGQWNAWFTRLKEQGAVVGGNPLEPQGKIVSGAGGRVVADGPFSESKEAIGGYFMLKVNSMDEAVTIAKGCPGLPFGVKVEVRPVAEQCSILAEDEVEKDLANAVA